MESTGPIWKVEYQKYESTLSGFLIFFFHEKLETYIIEKCLPIFKCLELIHSVLGQNILRHTKIGLN